LDILCRPVADFWSEGFRSETEFDVKIELCRVETLFTFGVDPAFFFLDGVDRAAENVDIALYCIGKSSYDQY